LPRAELAGRTLGEVFPDHLSIGLLEDYARVVETGCPFFKESQRYVKADRKGRSETRYVDIQAVKAGDHLALIWCDLTGQRRAEEELRRSHLKMQAALDNMVRGFVLLDLEARVLMVNPVAHRDVEAMYGSPVVEGASFLDIIPDRDRESFKRHFGAVAAGRQVRLEYHISPPDGDDCWYDLVYSPIFDSEGKVWAVALTDMDITHRRWTEEALRVKEERYELATRAASAGVWEWNLKTGDLYLDPNLKAMLGYSDDEVPNDIEKWVSLVYPEDRQAVMEAAEAHIAGHNDHYALEHRMLHRDGSVRWVSARGAAVRDAQGNAVKMLGTDADITDRKYIELALQESEERLRAIWEAATDAMVLSDSDGTVLDANPAYLALCGYPSGQVIGRKFSIIFPEDQQEWNENQYRASFHRWPTTSRFESTVRRMDGPERTIESRIAFMYKNRRRNAMLSTIRDITDTKQTQEALLKAHAELTTLLEVSQNIVSTLDLESLLNLVLEKLESVIPYDAAVIGTLSDNHLELQAYRGPELVFRSPLLQFDAAKIPGLSRIAQTLAVLYVPDTDDNPDLAHALSDALGLPSEAVSLYHTWMAMPLISQGRMVGVLILMNQQAGSYDQRTHSLARAFANQVAIAIENAQLYSQAKETAALAERARLARDLHDSVTQTVYGINMYTEAARLALAAGKSDVTLQGLAEIKDMAREAMADLRLMIFSSSLPTLEQEGLAPAIRARLEAVESRAGFAVEFNVEGIQRPRPDVEVELYYVAQEALNNIIKHARANRVKVDLRLAEDRTILVVQDDGIGFDIEAVGSSVGLGLRSIRERIQSIGGKVELRSVPLEGTTLKIEVEI
jgi:PAS domain S-box-containing protein